MFRLLSTVTLALLLLSCEQQSYESNRVQKRNVTPKAIDATPEDNQVPEDTDTQQEQDEVVEPDVEAPAVIVTSKGTGGPTGFNEVNYTDANGTLSSYKIDAPADVASKVYGLHIHFHGDGGGGYVDFPNQETRDDLIGVTVKSPSQALTWGRANGVEHAFYAHDLIQNELLKKYDIELSRIYFSAVSGGAYFMSGNFLPSYGANYKSGAFLMCGGEAPRVNFVEPDFLKEFRIHWQVTAGERQDILASVNNSINQYKTALDNLDPASTMQSSEIAGDGGHCVFDGISYTTGIQQMIDNGFKTILPVVAE